MRAHAALAIVLVALHITGCDGSSPTAPNAPVFSEYKLALVGMHRHEEVTIRYSPECGSGPDLERYRFEIEEGRTAAVCRNLGAAISLHGTLITERPYAVERNDGEVAIQVRGRVAEEPPSIVVDCHYAAAVSHELRHLLGLMAGLPYWKCIDHPAAPGDPCSVEYDCDGNVIARRE